MSLSRAMRRRAKRSISSATVECRGLRWVRFGAFVCRWLPVPVRWRVALMNRVFLPRFQYRTRIGGRATEWAPVGGTFEMEGAP